MMHEPISILIIDDAIEVIKTLSALLRPDYRVYFATEGPTGLKLARQKKPDLILLDVMMEPIDGYEVCRRLKSDPETQDIPVIFVTAASDTEDEKKGFEIGAADYIRKPFVPVVTLARIHHHAQLSVNLKEIKRLYSLALDANPITKLPGNNSIRKHIEDLLKTKQNRSVLYCDLDSFKSYNDKYGFAKGDDIILFTAQQMQSVAKALNINDIFFGHVGGDDFVVTLDSNQAEQYASMFIQSFDKLITQFYTKEDVDLGYIISTNREGETMKFPFVSISISGVDLSEVHNKNYLEISDICAEIKHKVKMLPGSNYLFERRKA
ncbi:MAG: response regulator [Eubacteriales bacterium]